MKNAEWTLGAWRRENVFGSNGSRGMNFLESVKLRVEGFELDLTRWWDGMVLMR